MDEGTAICFEDWLSGYVRNGEQRVPIPVRNEIGIDIEVTASMQNFDGQEE